MLNLPSTVSVNPTGYFHSKTTKQNRHRENYFRDYYQKHRERLLTPQRREQQKLWIAQKRAEKSINTSVDKNSLLWSDHFTCKKPWCSTCIQAGIKENEYKFCGSGCIVNSWTSIYAKIYAKRNTIQHRTKCVNDKISSHTIGMEHACLREKNLFFCVGECHADDFVVNTFLTAEQIKKWNKSERQKRKDQPWRRLATKNKIAQVAGYNLPSYQEKRSIAELLKKHGEFAYLTGKPLGRYYLSTLDLDLRKVEFPEKLVECLEKNVGCLLDFLRVSYDKTKKGLHVDILTPELLPNEIIYYRGWGKVWNVGSIQSKGKYVVGEDKEKEFVKNGKWYWKVDRNEEIRAKLAKFLLMVGKGKEAAKEPANSSSQNFKKVSQIERIKQIIQAKILGVKETRLTDFLKVFYLNQRSQTRGYFLLNSYQKPNALPNLDIGSVRSICLVSGWKQKFFSRMRL